MFSTIQQPIDADCRLRSLHALPLAKSMILNCAIGIIFTWVANCRADDVVYVAMRSNVQATRSPVLLGDVADVLTDDGGLRAQLAKVDVTDAPGQSDSIEITRKQIELRLRLAGYQTDDFRIVGAQKTEIRSQGSTARNAPTLRRQTIPLENTSLEEQITGQLTTALAELWQMKPDRIQVSLLKALPESDLTAAFIESVDVVVPAFQKPGNMRPRVSLFAGGKLLDVWNVSAEALAIHDVVVVNKTIEKGQIVSVADISVVPRPLRNASQFATMDQTVGKSVRRTLSPGHLVQSQDLIRQRQTNQTLIRSRDPVRLVARRGNLTVVVTDAVALQAGNPGDLIRVRNPRSSRVVVGRVDEKGEVIVSL